MRRWFALFPVVLLLLLLIPPAQGGPKPLLNHRLSVASKGITLSYPDGWSAPANRFTNMTELVKGQEGLPLGAPALRASIKITTESRLDHADAVERLFQIASGNGASPSVFLSLGDRPALQLRSMEERAQPSRGPQFADKHVLRIITAVAAGSVLVRVDAALPSDASEDLISQVEAIGRSVAVKGPGTPQVQETLQGLRRRLTPTSQRPDSSSPVAPPLATADASGLDARSRPLGAGTPGRKAPFGPPVGLREPGTVITPAEGVAQRIIVGRNGELEIAVSPDGQNIVLGQQSAFRSSNDGGQTFPFQGVIAFNFGDPSLAYGQSGNFYYAGIRGGCRAADAAGPFGYTCTGIARSTNNGQTFPIVANAVVCPNNDPNAPPNVAGTCFPDQEHIAADRWNAAAGGDQVYSTWRNFDTTDQDPGLVCSQDSGITWSAPITVGTGAFPRIITVGQDGFVYVVYLDGGNYAVNKYSSCANGLVAQAGFPRVITARIPVVCPFVGHDRCDQNPSSQTIAVDETNANHIYFSYAENTAATNENIVVRDSLDGGVTWQAARRVQVNGAVNAERIMPWLCSTGGEAFVTWYDRRNATAGQNDLTDYFGGRAFLDGGGNLAAGADFRITTVSDPWCASGWPCSTREVASAEQCSVQPQLAGRCADANPATADSNLACDFSDGGCPSGEACRTGGGCPKYGDYNGNACGAGRLFVGWASATSPPGINPASTSIDIFFDSLIVHPADVTVTKSDAPDPVLVGGNLTYTVTVTNSGPNQAFAVSLRDTLPAGVTFVSASSSQGTCSQSAGVVTCAIGNIANGASVVVTIVATPNADGLITNTATVSAGNDPNAANNTAVENTVVQPVADIVVTKAASTGVLDIGAPLTYTIQVRNDGPSTATGVTLTDTLPAGVILVSFATTQGTCGAPTLTCNLGTLLNGATATITVVIRLFTPAPGGLLTNLAAATATEFDPNLANNSSVVNTATVPRGNNMVDAGAFIDNGCDGSFDSPRDTRLPNVPATLTFPNGASWTIPTRAYGGAVFSNIDGSGGLMAVAVLPPIYLGVDIESCPGSPLAIPLTAADFSLGAKVVSFRARKK